MLVSGFSATVASERAHLGDRVTQWLAEHPALEIVDLVVTQSSDAAFHCLTISVFAGELDRGSDSAAADDRQPNGFRSNQPSQSFKISRRAWSTA